MVYEVLSPELPPEDPDADEAGAEKKQGGGFWDSGRGDSEIIRTPTPSLSKKFETTETIGIYETKKGVG